MNIIEEKWLLVDGARKSLVPDLPENKDRNKNRENNLSGYFTRGL